MSKCNNKLMSKFSDVLINHKLQKLEVRCFLCGSPFKSKASFGITNSSNHFICEECSKKYYEVGKHE